MTGSCIDSVKNSMDHAVYLTCFTIVYEQQARSLSRDLRTALYLPYHVEGAQQIGLS